MKNTVIVSAFILVSSSAFANPGTFLSDPGSVVSSGDIENEFCRLLKGEQSEICNGPRKTIVRELRSARKSVGPKPVKTSYDLDQIKDAAKSALDAVEEVIADVSQTATKTEPSKSSAKVRTPGELKVPATMTRSLQSRPAYEAAWHLSHFLSERGKLNAREVLAAAYQDSLSPVTKVQTHAGKLIACLTQFLKDQTEEKVALGNNCSKELDHLALAIVENNVGTKDLKAGIKIVKKVEKKKKTPHRLITKGYEFGTPVFLAENQDIVKKGSSKEHLKKDIREQLGDDEFYELRYAADIVTANPEEAVKAAAPQETLPPAKSYDQRNLTKHQASFEMFILKSPNLSELADK